MLAMPPATPRRRRRGRWRRRSIPFSSGASPSAGWDLARAPPAGTLVWARRDGGPGNGDGEAWGVGVSPDGSRVLVTGGSLGSTGHFDYATIAYDASTGATQWLARYNGPAANTDNFAYALGVSP